MSNDLSSEYFERLWLTNKPKWEAADVPAAAMKDGATVPADFCLATVARLKEQFRAPTGKISDVIEHLRSISSDQFYYPFESRHITLLGCTQRSPIRGSFTEDRIRAVRENCATVIEEASPVSVRLNGLGILGNQIFVQVYAKSDGWEALRKKVSALMVVLGEEPIAYPNMAPIHLNIARITNNDKSHLSSLLAEVEKLHNHEFGELDLEVVELLLTDFVLSPSNTSIHGRTVLKGSR